MNTDQHYSFHTTWTFLWTVMVTGTIAVCFAFEAAIYHFFG